MIPKRVEDKEINKQFISDFCNSINKAAVDLDTGFAHEMMEIVWNGIRDSPSEEHELLFMGILSLALRERCRMLNKKLEFLPLDKESKKG